MTLLIHHSLLQLFNGILTPKLLPVPRLLCNLKIKPDIMTKKEQMPKGNKDERKQDPKDIDYNPDITPEDKSVLNNQSKDERSANGENDYFEDRDEPIDYVGEDLDLPEMDDKQFNQTRNEPDEAAKSHRPKESVNSNDDAKENTETVYKGEKAEKYPGREEVENKYPSKDQKTKG